MSALTRIERTLDRSAAVFLLFLGLTTAFSTAVIGL